MKSFRPCVIGLVVSAILTVYDPFCGLAVGQADVRENAAEHLFPGGQPVLGRVVGAVDRDVPVSRANEVEDRLLLAGRELEFVVAAIGGDDDQVVLADGRRFQDGGVLADRDLEPAGVLQRAGQVQCLVAVSVMLALAAREQEDLGAVGRFLLRQGRVRWRNRQDQAHDDDSRLIHGRRSCRGVTKRWDRSGVDRCAFGNRNNSHFES